MRERFGLRRADVVLSPQHRRGMCFGLTVTLTTLLSVLLILNDVGRGPDDDLGIAMMLSGIYPESGQCPFTNALINNVLFYLNQIAPALNWTLVIERLSAMAAFFVAVYGLLRYLPWGPSLAVAGFIAFLIYPLCTISANFTVVAALSIFAGELSVALFVLTRRRSWAVAGIALVVLGFSWRSSVLLLSLPFFLFALRLLTVSVRRERMGLRLPSLRRAAFCLGAILVLAGGLALYHQAVWSAPDLARWQAYSDARSRLCDYPVKPYEEIADELAALDVSENDYWCMTHWITADPDFFTVERLRAVADVAADPSNKTVFGALKSEIRSLIVERTSLLIGFALVGVAVILGRSRRVAAVLIASAVLCFSVCAYFRYTGRLPVRVEFSAWMFSLMPILALVASSPSSPLERQTLVSAVSGASNSVSPVLRRQRAAGVLGAATLVAACVGLTAWCAPTVGLQNIVQFQQTSDFAESRPLIVAFQEGEGVNVWDPYSFPYVERELAYRSLPPRSFMERNTFAGGWTAGSAPIALKNAALGVSNPLKSLAERPDLHFVSVKKKTVKHVQRYLREHYAPHIKKRTDRKIPVKAWRPGDEGKTLYVVSFHELKADG